MIVTLNVWKGVLIPRLIVFDLDHTLWPFGVDQFVFKPPYRVRNDRNDRTIVDSLDREMKCYEQVPHILNTLYSVENKPRLAVASRTEYPFGALSLIQLFGWNRYFRYKQIHATPKTIHFQQFTSKSLINYKDMLFFDDEQRNIDDIEPLGVTCILVDSNTGLTTHLVNDGIQKFNESQSKI